MKWTIKRGVAGWLLCRDGKPILTLRTRAEAEYERDMVLIREAKAAEGQ